MRLGALAMVVLLLAPLAAAGSEDDPEVPGIEDLEDPALDFQGAWFEPARDGIRFTVKFGGADEAPADHYFFVAFTYGGERHVAVVAFDADGALRTDVRPTNFNRQRVAGPEALDDRLEDAAFAPGYPAYVSALIPHDALPGMGPGKVIIDLGGGTGFYERGVRAGWNDVDGRETQNAYVVQSALLPKAIERNLGWIALALLLLLAGVVAALVVLLRRQRAAATVALPPPAQPAAPPQPRARVEGEPKFRIDPRR